MAWRLALVIGLAALLCPALAKAQTNLDQGKSPAQIFATVCVECHKEPHGLAKGRSGSALADFLREHYTTNSQQAAALAAYVLGGRSADTGAAPQGRGAKPAPEHASVEEPKSNRQGRLSAKPEERSKRTPSGRAAKPAEQDSDEEPTIMRPVLTPPGATAHNRRKEKEPRTAPPTATTTEPDAGPHPPAAAAAEPTPASEPPPREQSAPAPAATAAAPAEATPAAAAPAQSGENAPVPRDHIPD